jgi:hypothetical protein
MSCIGTVFEYLFVLWLKEGVGCTFYDFIKDMSIGYGFIIWIEHIMAILIKSLS